MREGPSERRKWREKGQREISRLKKRESKRSADVVFSSHYSLSVSAGCLEPLYREPIENL